MMPLNLQNFDFTGFDAAVERNMLPDLDSVGHRIKIYRRRLARLGYLEKEGEEVNDSVLADALGNFQKDVGLDLSCQPDKATFDALEALVAFEPKSGSLKYLQSLPDNNIALNKARQLRLKAYGLVSEHSSQMQIEASLRFFNTLCFSLFIPGIRLNMPMREVDAYLFNLDKVTMGLQGDDREINIRVPNRFRTGINVERKFKERLKNFVYHLASIELWLSGYPVKLDQLNTRNDNFKNAIKRFWADAPQRVKPPRKYREAASFAFFQRINSLQDTPTDDERTQRTMLFRLYEDAPFRLNIEKQSQNFVSRLFDGIRRAVRVIFDLFRRGVKLAASLIKNSARWFVSRANTVYQGIRTIFQATKIGMTFVKNDNALWTDAKELVIRKSTDLDHQIYINNQGNSVVQAQILQRYHVAASLFSIALQGIGLIWQVLSKLISLFGGVTSWFLALWSLIKLNEEVIEIDSMIQRFFINKT